MKLKKAVAGILVSAVVLSIGTTSAFAHGHGRRFVNSDCNSVCDNYGESKVLLNKTCRFFIDEDCDGICDNCSSENCQGRGYGLNNRQGLGYRGVCRR